MTIRTAIYSLAAAVAAVLFACRPSFAQDIADDRIIDAVDRYSEWDFDGAMKILDGILKDDPANDAAWYYKGLCNLFLKDYDNACANLRKAAAIDSTNYWYRFNLAGAYRMAGQADMTIAQYNRLLKDFPEKTDISYNLVDLYLRENRYDEALATIRDIEAVNGKNDGTVMTSYRILLQQKKQEEALGVLKSYNEEYSSPQVLSMLGDHEMGMFNDSTAIAYYDEALSLDSGYAPARLGKAEAYRMTRRYPEYFREIGIIMADDNLEGAAKADYLSQVIRNTDPRFLQTWRDSMDSTFGTILEHHAKDSSVLKASSLYYFYTGRIDRTKELGHRLMEADPDNEYSAGYYLGLLQVCQDYEALVEEARKAEERFPGVFLEQIAFGEYNLGHYDKVIEAYQELIRKHPGDREVLVGAYSGIGDMYHLLNDGKSAFKYYEKALKINPDYAPVLNNYAYYLSLGGKKMSKAYRMSKKTVEAEPDNATYLDTFGWILHLMGKDLEAKPFFKHAMLYGGKESRTVLLHYSAVLEALGETDLAKVYADMAEKIEEDE